MTKKTYKYYDFSAKMYQFKGLLLGKKGPKNSGIGNPPPSPLSGNARKLAMLVDVFPNGNDDDNGDFNDYCEYPDDSVGDDNGDDSCDDDIVIIVIMMMVMLMIILMMLVMIVVIIAMIM